MFVNLGEFFWKVSGEEADCTILSIWFGALTVEPLQSIGTANSKDVCRPSHGLHHNATTTYL
jgi:hypothetical protein